MSRRMILAILGSRTLVTQTYYSNATWVAPVTTNRMELVQGQGGAGAAAVPAIYDSGSTAATTMFYLHDSTAYGTPGNLSWYSFNQALGAAVAAVNVGGGPVSFTRYDGEARRTAGGAYYYSESSSGESTPHGGIVAGSVTGTGSGGGSFDQVTGSSFQSWTGLLNYQYLRPGTGYSPTTGASATAFGLTFVGGYGGTATPSTQGPVTVTPTASYSIVVPSGGFVTIQYYQ